PARCGRRRPRRHHSSGRCRRAWSGSYGGAVTDAGALLHITTAAPWRMALAAGSLVTPSLRSDGFVHLSRPDQVALPANRLYAGRDDLLLLVLDPARLASEVRWEPGVP